MFELDAASGKPKILEAWAIGEFPPQRSGITGYEHTAENPNHGRSAMLNAQSLKENYPEFPCAFIAFCTDCDPEVNARLVGSGWIYPRAMLTFLKSKPGGVDFQKRNLVLVGHSYGGHSVYVVVFASRA